MRQTIWIVLACIAVVIVWRLFWASAFAIWDHANSPFVLFLFGAAVAYLYFRGRKKQRRKW